MTGKTGFLRGQFGRIGKIGKRDTEQAGDILRRIRVRRTVGMLKKAACAGFTGGVTMLLCAGHSAFETMPFGLALLCAEQDAFFPSLAGAVLGSVLFGGEQRLLLLVGVLLSFGMRYVIGQFVRDGADTAADGADGKPHTPFSPSALRLPLSMRLAVAVIAAFPTAAGILIGGSDAVGDGFSVRSVCACLFFLCAVTALTALFAGAVKDTADTDADIRILPAHRDAGISALAFAVTVSCGNTLLFGISLRLLCAMLFTLTAAKRGGYLRGTMTGLFCGLGCDVLYAPTFAIVGAAAGLLRTAHEGLAALLALLGGTAYAVYTGGFVALRTVVPALICGSAVFYPVARYLPETLYPAWLLPWTREAKPAPETSADAAEKKPADAAVRARNPTVTPSLDEQLDALSGILHGLSSTFSHLSDCAKKPGLYEIRQLCEGCADRYCRVCDRHADCWETHFSETADTMSRITLSMHKKGHLNAEGGQFAPLDTRCPHFARMLSDMNEASAALFEEKVTEDKMTFAAEDYDGMACLLRASAEEYTRACAEDKPLSGRMTQVMANMGFSCARVSVYGKRRNTVVANGITLGAENTLLATEDLRTAFSSVAGVHYDMPDYRIDGDGAVSMTLYGVPRVRIAAGCFGVGKEGESVTGDVLSLFQSRADYHYTVLCDGMGSGRAASVTAQISALFLEKLLSVSTARGAAVKLLNAFLRSRMEECSATVDLCEIDLLTGDARFLKCGAAPSYLIRGERIFRIASGTLPIGILSDVVPEETAFMLCDGDILLFFSDGVLGEYEDTAWILSSVRTAIRRGEVLSGTDEDGRSALTLAAELFGHEAERRVGRQDDMTAAILRVEMTA